MGPVMTHAQVEMGPRLGTVMVSGSIQPGAVLATTRAGRTAGPPPRREAPNSLLASQPSPIVRTRCRRG